MDKTEHSEENFTGSADRDEMRKAVSAVVLVGSPLVMFGVFETITENLFKIDPESVFWNLVFYAVIYFAVLGITHSERGGFTFLNIFFTVWAIAEYFVVSFRRRPIMIFDVTAFRTAMTVAGNYEYIPTVRMVCGVIFIIIWTVLIWKFTVRIKTGVRGWILSAAASVAACIITPALFLGIGMYVEHFSVDMWEPINSFETEGTLVSTICSFFYLGSEEPEGYSLARVDEIKEAVEAGKDDEELVFGTENSTVPTNIICIMNESFADLRRVGEFETDVEFMPFLDSLTENCVKGDLFVPVFGSMTCNTEWEFLTGNSMTFVPEGSVPFQTYMKTPSYSIVSVLKDEGYRAVAMHPNPGYNWNRSGAYSALGFDEFYDIDDFPDDAPIVRGLTADQADYEMIIDLVENKEEGEPLFIFDVTLQNHGGYTENWEGDVHLTEYDEFPQTEQYLSLVKISDEEFEFLIDYFENIDEPTMIVMFGDHQPSVEEEFYEELYGGALSEFPYAQLVRRYITPFIIWTNYPTESMDDVIMSPMYLGMAALERANIELTDYLYFENELYKHAPVIHFYGYKQADGSLIDWSRYKTRPEWEYLDAYKILHYNNVFDNNRDDTIYRNEPGTSKTGDGPPAGDTAEETTEDTSEESINGSVDEETGTDEYTNAEAVEAARENLEELQAVNPDVVGWLTIPGTSIDYPILQGEDNDYYLHRNWEREESTAGSIFLDYACESDLSGLHNVIYGHHMKDGSMFRELMNFREPDFFDSHRDIYIYTNDGIIKLRTFACTYVPSEPIRRKTDFSSDDEFYSYIDEMTAGAGIDYGYEREDISRLYSFITCSYEFDDARTILYAYEI